MARTHHVTIDGKRWTLKFTRLSGDAAGWTFFENAAKPRRILVDERLKGGAKLETVVHELLHACLGSTISEHAVTETAKVIRRTLVALKFKEAKDGR